MLELESVQLSFRPLAPLRGLLRGRIFQAPIQALDDLNLKIDRGDSLALLGANGAGKSSLLRLLAGLIYPSAGQVQINGRVALASGEERSFYWRLSLRENLRYFAALGDLPSQRVEEVLLRVGLQGRAEQLVRQCSSGIRARLSLARALLSRPEILLLDEVDRALDPEGRGRLLELLNSWEGCVLMATHDLQLQGPLEALLLEKGRLIGRGAFQEIAQRLRSIQGQS